MARSFGIVMVNGDLLEYSDFVDKLLKPLEHPMNLAHLGLGVAGEAGELVDAIKKHIIYEKDIDRNNVVEEIGDALFYLQGIMNTLDISIHEVLMSNVGKLRKRYKKLTYSNKAAQERADKVDDNDGSSALTYEE